jgi:hypothetical protein
MNGLKLFIPITKIDVEKQLVFGRIAEETPDSGGEIFDYETSKPFFTEWSDFFAKTTDGKSVGNVRVQHDPQRNAGHLTDIVMLDEDKAIEACAKINDADEWQRLMDGDYTGFSIGGKYVKKWTDGNFKRYTAQPNEVSIVDYPAHKSCTFDLIKADGTKEPHAFKNIAPAKKGEPTNVRKTEILADLKKWAGQEIYDVSTAVRSLVDIVYLFTMEEGEDHPEAAAQLDALKAVITNLKAFIASEITEAEPDDVIRRFSKLDEEKMQKVCETLGLEKKGAAISSKNLEKIQAVHDHSVDLGAKCSKEAAEGAGDLQKVAGERDEAITKADALTKETEELKKTNAAQAEEIAKFKAEPAPAKGVTKVVTVTKADDAAPVNQENAITIDPHDPKSVEAGALAMIKAAHGKPQNLTARKALLSPEDLKIETA